MGTLAEAETAIREAAISLVQEPGGGVRVEDYLATLAAATGEAALAASGFDVEHHALAPGSALFHDPVNARLTGDPVTTPAPAGTVWSMLEPLVAKGVLPAHALPDPTATYRHVAESVGRAPWGEVSTTVGDDHRPLRPPLRSAFELRPAVLGVEQSFNASVTDRHVVTASALASAIEQTKDAIDPALAVRLAVEILFGMAKMAPMTAAALASATR